MLGFLLATGDGVDLNINFLYMSSASVRSWVKVASLYRLHKSLSWQYRPYYSLLSQHNRRHGHKIPDIFSGTKDSTENDEVMKSQLTNRR